MRHFSAPFSLLIKVITLFTLIVTAGIATFGLSSGSWEGLLVLGAMLLPGLFTVKGYAVGRRELIVKRPLWNTRIDLTRLSEASLMPELATQMSWSLFSTRGFFGMIGYAYKKGLGVFLMYVTDPSKAVLLRFPSRKPIVVSPDSPKDFLGTILRAERL